MNVNNGVWMLDHQSIEYNEYYIFFVFPVFFLSVFFLVRETIFFCENNLFAQ